jgi:hypothetical protein
MEEANSAVPQPTIAATQFARLPPTEAGAPGSDRAVVKRVLLRVGGRRWLTSSGAAGADGGDDLLGVDSLQVDRGRAEIGVAELALDDVQRDALAGELERVRMAQLMRREPTPHTRARA